MVVGRILNQKLMVDVVTEIECSICKQTYFPDKSDISLNGNQYFKNCKGCRAHRLELKNNSIIRRRGNPLKYARMGSSP